jgi:periplasmic divalent cation tolerance protein
VDRVRALHPYEVPEVVAVPIEAGFDGYLDWVVGSLY